MKRLLILLVVLVGIAVVWEVASRYFPQIRELTERTELVPPTENTRILREENLVIDVVKEVGPSVITIGVHAPQNSRSRDPFSFFFGQPPEPESDTGDDIQYIGSGFVVDRNGMIVTNKHVVSDIQSSYVVVNDQGESFEVERIYRDPLNDIAILRIQNGNLPPVELGDSSQLQVGQFVIAIGTALGEFRNTVTTGVISGLGRGITAGSPFEGFVERLDNVIQTDAAVNPGNSGGPLLNSAGQVIGVNTAVAAGGQNIAFTIPINVVKDSLQNFNETGQFNRPFIGVAYTMVSRQSALANDVPQGAFVQEVVANSPAQAAGIQEGDIITKIDGKAVTDENGGLAGAIANNQVNDTITIEYFRNGQTEQIQLTLGNATEQ